MADNFVNQLKEFIETNKGKKFHNSNIDQKYYDKILERKLSQKRTNVRAIKNIYKLVHYYLAENMLGIYSDIPMYIDELVGWNLKRDFVDMFSEVEYETPEVRRLKNPHIEYINNEFYIYDNGNRIKVDYDTDSLITYKLLPNTINLSIDCWKDFESECKVPITSISTDTSGNFIGNVTLDKTNGTYILKNLIFLADYNIDGIYILARYSGLRRTAWICESSLVGQNHNSWEVCNWPGDDNIQRGRIYLVKNHHVIASIKGDWDGAYNNISFDKLKTLLENLS